MFRQIHKQVGHIGTCILPWQLGLAFSQSYNVSQRACPFTVMCDILGRGWGVQVEGVVGEYEIDEGGQCELCAMVPSIYTEAPITMPVFSHTLLKWRR